MTTDDGLRYVGLGQKNRGLGFENWTHGDVCRLPSHTGE